jgi:hypothetical protein
MRRVATAVLLPFLATQGAFAAPLPAGKPAGIKQAQDRDYTPLLVMGAAAVGIGIALAVSDNGNSGSVSPPPTTTTTTTTGTGP